VGTGAPSYRGFRFPVEIISHCVWLYYRFPLSFRDVEEMMLQRGIVVGVSVRKLPGAAIGGISPGQRTATAALWHSRQRPVRQTISVVTSNNSRVCGS
jgi:hypothetical protein